MDLQICQERHSSAGAQVQDLLEIESGLAQNVVRGHPRSPGGPHFIHSAVLEIRYIFLLSLHLDLRLDRPPGLLLRIGVQ